MIAANFVIEEGICHSSRATLRYPSESYTVESWQQQSGVGQLRTLLFFAQRIHRLEARCTPSRSVTGDQRHKSQELYGAAEGQGIARL